MRKPMVFIIGFPRTATTGIYREICGMADGLFTAMGYGRPLCIYEPFNPEVVSDIARRGVHEHDRVGRVPHTYSDLPKPLFELIRRNSAWLEGFMEHGEPYMGEEWRDVLDGMLEHAEENGRPVVVKDVYAWPRLGEIVRLYGDRAVFVVPRRNRFYILRSLMWWMGKRRGVRLLRRHDPRKLVDPRRVIRFLRYYLQSRRVVRSDNMFGLAYFYKFFYGSILDNHFPPQTLLTMYFHATYSIYEELCHTIIRTWGRDLDIIIPSFRDRLGAEQLRFLATNTLARVLGEEYMNLVRRRRIS